MPYTPTAWVDRGAPAINASRLNKIETGIKDATDIAEAARESAGAASGMYGARLLESFPGATDDDKLTAALSYAAAQTQIPAIAMPTNRRATFAQGGRVPFSGMKLIGGPGGNRNPELSGGKLVSSMVKLTCGSGTSSWFNGSGSLYNILVKDIGFEGTSSTQFWHHPSSAGTLYSCRFESLGFNLFKHIFGTVGQNVGLTQVEFSGHWTVNNAWDQQFNLGGSDNQLWFDGYINIGTGQSAALAGDNSKFYIVCTALANTQLGYIYASGLNGYNTLRITGNSDGITLHAPVLEGYKATGLASDGSHTLANPGNVLRIEGGSGTVIGGNFGQGMAQPVASHHGLIEVTGGEWNFIGPNFYKGAMAESVPSLYNSGGIVNVFGATRRQAESWSARPGVKTVGGTTTVFPSSSMTVL